MRCPGPGAETQPRTLQGETDLSPASCPLASQLTNKSSFFSQELISWQHVDTFRSRSPAPAACRCTRAGTDPSPSSSQPLLPTLPSACCPPSASSPASLPQQRLSFWAMGGRGAGLVMDRTSDTLLTCYLTGQQSSWAPGRSGQERSL